MLNVVKMRKNNCVNTFARRTNLLVHCIIEYHKWKGPNTTLCIKIEESIKQNFSTFSNAVVYK